MIKVNVSKLVSSDAVMVWFVYMLIIVVQFTRNKLWVVDFVLYCGLYCHVVDFTDCYCKNTVLCVSIRTPIKLVFTQTNMSPNQITTSQHNMCSDCKIIHHCILGDDIPFQNTLNNVSNSFSFLLCVVLYIESLNKCESITNHLITTDQTKSQLTKKCNRIC